MALYINGNKVVSSLVIDGFASQLGGETIWTSGDMHSPAAVNTPYTFSKTLDNFDLIKVILTSTNDSSGTGICGTDIWSVKSINDAITNSQKPTPSPYYKGIYGYTERFSNINFSNSGFTITANGQGQSVYAIVGIKCSQVDKIFDTGSITSLVPVNSQQSLLKPLSDYDLIQIVFSNVNDGANGVTGTDYIDVNTALTTGMICKSLWYKYRQMTTIFTNTTFTITSSSANAEASGYGPQVYQIYGIKLCGIKEGSGGCLTPTFSETVLVDNSSSLATSFTFSEDYHNYDFLKFIIYNTSSGVETSIITTHSAVDAIFSIGNYINFNEFCNNQYCTYTQSNLTWNRSGSRSCLISKVIGLNCTNLTVEETEIYKATSQTGTSVDITTQEDLMSFDWILFCSNDGSYDEVQPCINIFVPSNNIYELKDEYALMYVFNPYNTYSVVYITKNHISSNTYAYVVGIKFT